MEQKPSSSEEARKAHTVAEEELNRNNYMHSINQRGRGIGSGRGRGIGIGRGRGRRSDIDSGNVTKQSGRGNGGIASSSSEELEVVIEKPIYSCKVNELRPGTMGHTLTVKVLHSTPISTPTIPVAECLVGDDTAVILFTARGSQGK
jgi:hypothetical protein